MNSGRVTALLCLVLASCATGANVRDDQDASPEVEAPVSLRATETFDPSPYEDSPVLLEADVAHDVPRLLMESRADSGIVRVIDGFRIQIFQSLNRAEAIEVEEKVRFWWPNRRPEPDSILVADSLGLLPPLPDRLGIYNLYKQPYYRVRIGDFVNRGVAERVHALILRRYPRSLIVPDQIIFVRN